MNIDGGVCMYSISGRLVQGGTFGGFFKSYFDSLFPLKIFTDTQHHNSDLKQRWEILQTFF